MLVCSEADDQSEMGTVSRNAIRIRHPGKVGKRAWQFWQCNISGECGAVHRAS